MKKPVKKAAQQSAPKSNVPAVKKNNLPATTQAFEGGEGFENVTARDVIIPRITILQSMSDQLKKKHALYIEGAQVGQFCNVALGTILEEPLILIPCFYAMVYIEWAPRGSDKGLIRVHGTDASVLDETERDEETNKNMLPNGNYIAETATYFCLYQNGDGDWEKVFIPLASTQLKNSKRWMTKLKNEKIPRADGSKFNPNIYYRSWSAGTAEESNNKGDWIGWTFEPSEPIMEIDPTGALLNEAKEFCRQAKVGLVRGDVEGAANEDNRNNSGDAM
jgi:hypothetical protein